MLDIKLPLNECWEKVIGLSSIYILQVKQQNVVTRKCLEISQTPRKPPPLHRETEVQQDERICLKVI